NHLFLAEFPLLIGLTGFNRVPAIAAPFIPAPIVNCNIRPAHKIGIDKGFASSPAGTTIKRILFFWHNSFFCPLLDHFVSFADGVVEVSIVFHVIGITTTVTKYCPRNAPLFLDIVIPAALTNKFFPATYADQLTIIGINELLCFRRIHHILRMARYSNAEIIYSFWK